MPMFEVLDHSCNAFAQYHVGACHLKNYFCYHLPTRGRAGVKLGDVDTSKTYLSFLMLHACFTPILICFMCTLYHIMTFIGLTY